MGCEDGPLLASDVLWLSILVSYCVPDLSEGESVLLALASFKLTILPRHSHAC